MRNTFDLFKSWQTIFDYIIQTNISEQFGKAGHSGKTMTIMLSYLQSPLSLATSISNQHRNKPFLDIFPSISFPEFEHAGLIGRVAPPRSKSNNIRATRKILKDQERSGGNLANQYVVRMR
ncbi:hypothetical protein YC2023_052905 [Brassica napus]